MECDNCHAEVPETHSYEGMRICCIHCVFNPLGCQCHRGKFGESETQPHFEGGDETQESET